VAVRDGVYLNCGLCRCRQTALGLLAGCAETAESLRVVLEINLCLLFKLTDTVIDEKVVEILATKVRVTRSGLDLEDAVIV
jgi:hypothetical protein